MKVVLTGQILIRNDRIWTARPRIDHAAIFQASAPRIFNAAGLIGLVAAGDLAVMIASVVAVAIVLVAVAADLADLAAEAEDFEVVAGDKNKDLN